MILLTSGTIRCSVNTKGAWLETLSSDNTPILFPKAELRALGGDSKTRGGMHVCLPNFGPGGESGLSQHGFGRTSLWSVVQQGESSVALALNVTDGAYAGLAAQINYSLEGFALTASLSLKNESGRPLRVAPGFHPYFAVEASETSVIVNAETHQLNKLAGTEYRNADSAELITAARHITITTENLTTWAIWTDRLGNYVCVEPTFGGNRFLELEQPDEQLAPGETKTYIVTISW